MMSKPEFLCKRCGKCCKENWEITVDFQKDILRWIQEKRFDLLKHVVLNPKFILSPSRYDNNPQWIIDCGHVLFGDESHRCPFLDESLNGHPAGCSIHETRPQACRRFPLDENNRVRTDILDVCIGTIFYHSSAAEAEGMSLIEYMKKMDQEAIQGASLPPRKDELKEIAQSFKGLDMKIHFTSDFGLSIAEEALSKNSPGMFEKVYR